MRAGICIITKRSSGGRGKQAAPRAFCWRMEVTSDLRRSHVASLRAFRRVSCATAAAFCWRTYEIMHLNSVREVSGW